MTFDDERTAIVSELLTNWSTTPVRLENIEANFSDDVSSGYIALFVRPGEARQETLGPQPILNFIGVIIIQIFVPSPSTSGDKLARQYADTLSGIFRRKQLSSGSSGQIITAVPRISELPQINRGWFQVNLTIPYHRLVQDTA